MMRSRSIRWIASVAAVVLLLPGCGDTDNAGATDDAEAEVLATLEGFTAAVNAYDTEAIREYVTDDFTWQSTGPVNTLDEYLTHVDRYYEATDFHVEATSDPVVSLDGDEYVVVQQDADGKTSKEAIRALKRRISDVVYRRLRLDAAAN